jgi:hypothetical protein
VTALSLALTKGSALARASYKALGGPGAPDGDRSHIRRMIRLAISPAAFQAIVDTLPGSVNVENQRADNGDVYVWLDPGVVAKLKAPRGPGESYSDVILRAAAGEAGKDNNL